MFNLDVLPYDLAKYYAAEIVNGLEYIHSKGFVHRDIKPENIIINSKYHLKIVRNFSSRLILQRQAVWVNTSI